MATISNTELEAKLGTLEPNFYVIDVREPEEYQAGHIPNALLMPWHVIEDKIRGVSSDRELILYCETGVRAKKAAHFLEQLGYTHVVVCSPGWSEWERNHF